MNTLNKNQRRQKTDDGRRMTETCPSFVFCSLSSVLCLALLCCCLTAYGDEILINRVDVSGILDADNTTGPEMPLDVDIQTPPQIHWIGSKVTSPMLVPVTNPVVKVKDISRNTENNHSSYIYGPPSSGTSSSPTADDLRNIIEQIRSLSIEREQPPVTENKVQKTEDKEQKTDDAGLKTDDNKPKIENPSSALSPQPSELGDGLRQDIDALLKDPNRIANPLQLAEILFKIGKLGPAAVCYKQALATTAPDDPCSANERAWVLFQIGNCLKFDDPNAAKDSFAQLLRTYPDSPWSDAAKTCHELTAFLQQENPNKLIRELNPPSVNKPVQ